MVRSHEMVFSFSSKRLDEAWWVVLLPVFYVFGHDSDHNSSEVSGRFMISSEGHMYLNMKSWLKKIALLRLCWYHRISPEQKTKWNSIFSQKNWCGFQWPQDMVPNSGSHLQLNCCQYNPSSGYLLWFQLMTICILENLFVESPVLLLLTWVPFQKASLCFKLT